MKIALAQNKIIYGEKEKNLENALYLIEKAKKEKVDAIFFPEMSMVGASVHKDIAENEKLFDSFGETQTVDYFSKLAREMNIYIGIGWGRKLEEKGENRYTIINNKGESILDYGKIHPFSYGNEGISFKGADSIFTCKIKEFRVGVAICYDLRFPEIFTYLSEKADLIVVPANWPYARRDAWETLIKARAIENQAYFAGINVSGTMDNIIYNGGSLLVNPLGEFLAKGGKDEELIVFDIKNDTDTFREKFPVRKDRRKDLYREFL